MTGGLIMVWITSRYIDFYSEISNRIPRPRQVCSLIYTHLGNAHEPQRFSPVLTGRSIWSIGFFSSGNITLIIRGILISFSRTFWRNRPIYKYLHVQSWELELIHALQAAILQDSWQFQAFPRLSWWLPRICSIPNSSPHRILPVMSWVYFYDQHLYQRLKFYNPQISIGISKVTKVILSLFSDDIIGDIMWIDIAG